MSNLWHKSSGNVANTTSIDERAEKAVTPGTARIVERNIDALLKRHQQEENKNRLKSGLRMPLPALPAVCCLCTRTWPFGLWIIWSAGWLGLKPFDPSFIILAMEASVEAMFFSTFVRISQNYMNVQANKGADLDLQVSLLAEHEVPPYHTRNSHCQ